MNDVVKTEDLNGTLLDVEESSFGTSGLKTFNLVRKENGNRVGSVMRGFGESTDYLFGGILSASELGEIITLIEKLNSTVCETTPEKMVETVDTTKASDIFGNTIVIKCIETGLYLSTSSTLQQAPAWLDVKSPQHTFTDVFVCLEEDCSVWDQHFSGTWQLEDTDIFATLEYVPFATYIKEYLEVQIALVKRNIVTVAN